MLQRSADAASTRGVGTTFDCDTKIGPFRLTDRMEITEWVPNAAMGVSHVGTVTAERPEGGGTLMRFRLNGRKNS